MPLVIGVDTTLLALPSLILQQTPAALEAVIPGELNSVGHQLHYDIVQEVAEAFPDIPPQAIAAAIDSREATAAIPSFVIASRDPMVTYVTWVTQRDEKVCKICGPRDGVTYRIIDVMDIWPAHPNCRCRLERPGITDAMLAAGLMLLPSALSEVGVAVLAQFSRIWARHSGIPYAT
jgi:hypothetical protein